MTLPVLSSGSFSIQLQPIATTVHTVTSAPMRSSMRPLACGGKEDSDLNFDGARSNSR